MKNIYFLRHGQTVLNKKWVHQFPDTPLSGRGRVQAGAIGKKLWGVQIDVIVYSPLQRTKETADIISGVKGGAKGIKMMENKLLVELRRPRELWGVSWFSIKSFIIMGLLYINAKDPNYHYSDEENLTEFHKRAKKALDAIASMEEKNILVVTHRGIMASMMRTIKSDGMDSVTQNKVGLWKNLRIGNCCYITTEWKKDGEWGETLDGTWKRKKGMVCPR